MEVASSASEDQAMVVENYDDEVERVEMPKPTLKVSHEAKLKELLHKINSVEIKLCSDGTKEFIKLLKGDSGGELLHYYVKNSAKCLELLAAWKLRRGKSGMFCILKLISVILSHPDGIYKPNDVERMAISRALDRFARLLIEEQLQDVYKELNSKEAKRQKAALLLLGSIVRRGSGLASEVAKNFDFKLQGFSKMGEYKKKQNERRMKLSLRKAFVGFAVSFLEVGTPGLLRSVIRQKEMYSVVLRGLGNDDDETVLYVLSTLRNRILVEESSVSPSLRSVLFGSVTLEQLVNICGRENGGASAELAYSVLVMVCTDPCNGLMSDLKRRLRGNSKRLVDLMKKLKATEIGYHRDLLLAIVNGRPPIAAAYMVEFPYNLEDCASPTWFSVVTLAANVVSSVGSGHPFGFHDFQSHDQALLDNVDVQSIMKCLYPRSFSRSTINKGLLHSDFLVKHGTLRVLLEALKLLDSFLCVLNQNGKLYVSESFKQDFQNEVRTLLPDPQVLLTLLSSLSNHSKNQQLSLKRTAELEKFPEHSRSSVKKMKTDIENKDADIIIGGLNFDADVALPEISERIVGTSTDNGLDNEKDATNVMAEIWGLDLHSTSLTTLKDAEIYFHCRLLDALKIYLRIMPTVLEGSFEFFMNLLSSPSASQTDLQRSLLSLLVEFVGWSPSSRIPIRTPPLMYKHLLAFMNLLVFSQISDIKDQAYRLAQAAMLSTGAFDTNQHEIASWFLFLPGFDREKSSVQVLGLDVLQSLCHVVNSFLCDAFSTTGNNLFKYWEIVKRYTRPLEINKEANPHFSPLSICVLQKCLRLIDSGSGSFTMHEKSMVSTYVCSTLKYLLQTQVDAVLLSSLICSVLAERLGDCSVIDDSGVNICEWRPLNDLLLFSKSISDQKTCGIFSIPNKAMPDGSSLATALEEVKRFEKSRDNSEVAGITKAFSFSILCTMSDGILKYFPSVMTVSQFVLSVPVSLLSSRFFLEQTLLGSVSKLWPEIFFPALDMALSNSCCRGRNNFSLDPASYAGEMIYNQDVDADEAASAAFSFFLKKAPFHVLFPAIMSIHGPSSEPSKIQDLLLAKLSECATDCHPISYLRLVLFWLYQIRSSHRIEQLVNFQQLSEICLVLVDSLLSQLLVLNTDSGSSKNSWALLSSQDIQEVAETIFSHPAMITSFCCPLGCSEDSEDLPKSNLAENTDALIGLSRQRIHILDRHGLDILATTCDYFFSLCNDHQFTPEVENGAGKQFVKAFNILLQKLLQVVRDKFDQCISAKDLMPFLPTYYALHALIRFISPFELLELVRWMFSRVDIDDNQKSAISFGSCIAGGAFRNLSSYLQQPNTKRKSYDLFWKMEETSINTDIFEEIYSKVCKFSLHFKAEVVDVCLLEAINAVCRHKYMQQCNLHPLHIVLSRVIATTPVEMLSHCIYRTSKKRARFLSLLTDMSSMHLSTFGHLFLGILNKDFLHEGNVIEETCVPAFSDEHYLMLLPAALSYLNSVSMKFGRLCYKHFRNIPVFYSKILLNGFQHWNTFVSRDVFQEEFGEFLPSSAPELLCLIDDSLLGKAICMLRYHFSLNEDSMKLKKRLKLFNSIFPPSSEHNELIDSDVGGLGSQSLNESLNLVNKIFAKISFCKILLFPKGNQSDEAGRDLKNISLDNGSNKEDSSRMQFLNILVGIWQWIVKRVSSVSDSSRKETITDSSRKETITDSSSLWRCLEVLILTSILELTREISDGLTQLQSIPFLEQLMKSALLYRFEDPTTLKTVRDVLTFLSEGKFSRVPYLQLLLAHSQFAPTIRSVYKSSDCSIVEAFSRPMSGILRSLVFPSTNKNVIDGKCNLETTDLYVKQLEVIKLLRILFPIKVHQYDFDFAKDLGINLRELHLLLLSSYGSTLSEIDVEIYNLMRTIESIDDIEPVNFAGMDHLWGNAVLKIEKERTLAQNLSYDSMTDTEAVKERRRSQLRENLVIDPKICASTVLYFPYDRVTSEELLSLNKFQKDNFDDMRVLHSPDVENVERYNPVFILRFSIHSLAEGYIEPLEFAGLGLLGIAFMSMSSPDDRIRRLGYDSLGRFKNALEKCPKRKGVRQIQLLLTYVQNAIEEPWQRIPSVNAIFAAETSLILLDPSHDHYAALSKLLMRSSRLNVKNILFFSNFFWSSSINFKAERLWILRLVYAGLNFEDDAKIYMKNSILETLMSFYVSPISDDESKELILQVVKKAVKLHKMARYLVEQCGLFSWLSSVLSILSESHFRDEKSLFLLQLGVVSEVVNDVMSSRNMTEWLQKYALEQLMELTSHLYKFLVSYMALIKQKVAVVNPILGIIISTLKISQKRRIYQPHFILSIEGSYNIYKAVKICDNTRSCATAELGLHAILMSAPPVAIFCLSREKLSSFIMWAISAAVEVESAKMLQHKESHQCFAIIPEEELQENSLISKLLRWLTASVILGKLDWKSNYLDPEFPKMLNIKTLQSIMDHVESACRENSKSSYGCEEILASAILYLQQLAGTNYELLPSVTTALSLLLSDASIFAGFLRNNGSVVKSLWSKIGFPAEANPAWRWSFYQPWKDLTLVLTGSQKMEELHACQSLLVIISNVLGKGPSELQVSSTQEVDRLGVFEWERSIAETQSC